MSAVVSPVISDEEIVDELRAAWIEVSRGYARCWAAMAEVARRTTSGWESAEIAAALTFTARRADYELGCAQALIDRLPRVHTALAAGGLDHHKARVFTDYLADLTPGQADRICARLVPLAPGWTTGQLAARLLREVQAIDPDYTRRTYQQAVRQRAVHGYLDHTGTAVLTGSGLPAADAAAAAARLEVLADDLRSAGYPATVGQARADLYLRLLDGTLDGLSRPQIVATMLRLGPLTPADAIPDAEDSSQRNRAEADHEAPGGEAPEQSVPPEQSDQPAPAEQSAPPERPKRPQPPSTGCSGEAGEAGTSHPVRYGIEVRVRLSTLLGVDEHPAELPGWGPIPAPAARDLVATQHSAEWRIAIVDTEGYLLHGDLTRRRATQPSARGHRAGGIVEIALPVSMLDQLPALATEHPEWARVLHGISSSWAHRERARAALDQHPTRRFAHAALRRHIQMRDRHCIGVGCRRRAAAADLDHTHDHARGGQTITTNSGPNCARHHTMKHQGGWTLTQSTAGYFMWTSPLGQTYRTRGEPIIPTLPQPLPRDTDTDPPGVPMTWNGPVFCPPPPETRPPPTELPDQPPF
ncbi:MAG TPA: DUF222 domain-containing protein [Pseudonocardiaceae bacterium]|nr:DUF222 domain-containing protein [Pseudonocardiaceae bacterium]